MVNNILKLVLITLLSTISICHSAFALTALTASIDSNPVMSNESIVLTVTANDSVERDALDTSPLTADFIVARTEVSSQTSMVNFNTTRTTRWQIVLIPKKTGKLIIPALQIDNNFSKAITVEVLAQGNAAANKQQDIFISAELSANDVYVQQLVTLTVKLHIGVQLQRASLTEPQLTGATIVQIGEDKESDGIVNGKRYRIIERTYALTPEQSGEFTLTSPMFSGEVTVQSQRRSGFLSFGETKPVNILGDELHLNVRPIPTSYASNASWLPSELLTLHQEWQPNKSQFKVGEPITRTITLTAAGLAKEQLPNIDMPVPVGLKVYPDQAELYSNLSAERLVSQKKQNFALVASRAGEYVLPKITIAWWNTVTNKFQQAVLPEQTITVLPNSDAMAAAPVNKQANNISTSAEPLTPNINSNTTPQPIIIEENAALQWLFLALWLITLVAWLSHIRYLNAKGNSNKKLNNKAKVNDKYLALMAACKQNNAELALSLVVPWANKLLPTAAIASLYDAEMAINNAEFTSAIAALQQFLYGKDSTNSPWQGKVFLSVIQTINAKNSKATEQEKITLNPA